MENHAFETAEKIVLELDKAGIIDIEDCVLKEYELIEWLVRIIADIYSEPEYEIPPAPEVFEFGDGDGLPEKLEDEW